MAKPSKAWDKTSEQTSKIANEGRQPSRPIASKPDEGKALQPHEAPAPAPASTGKSSSEKRKSTSLYLTAAAHRAISMHAAEKGVRPHRIYDDALRAYFKAHGLEDFDKLNGIDP